MTTILTQPGAPGARTPPGPILVVEDDLAVREGVTRLLQAQGFVVHAAEDGLAALKLLEEIPGPFFLLFCDFNMPHKNGVELILEIQARRVIFATYVLITSLAETDERLNPLREIKARASILFLPKPFSADKLLSLVGRLRDRA